ncbi:MAG: tetratricopeptide repeat protein [Alphaproteobacteria bacterium]
MTVQSVDPETQADNALESSARALSEFVIRAAVLPVTLAFAKPRGIVRGVESGDYRPLPSPFLLALITGVVVSGVVSAVFSWISKLADQNQTQIANRGVEALGQAMWDFSNQVGDGGVKSIIFSLPYIGFVWIIAGCVSLLMARGIRSAEPIYAAVSFCWSAIVEVAVVVMLIGAVTVRMGQSQALTPAALVPLLLGPFIVLMPYVLFLTVKLIRVVLVIRADNKSSWIGAVFACTSAFFFVFGFGLAAAGLSVGVIAGAAYQEERAATALDIAPASADAADSQQLPNLDTQIRAQPNNAKLFVSRGDVFLSRGQVDRAWQDYDQSVWLERTQGVTAGNSASDMRADYATALERRAIASLYLKQYDKGVADMDEAIRYAPVNYAYYNERCWLRAIWGTEDQLNLALGDCHEALRLYPGESNSLDSLAFVQLRLGLYAESVANYRLSLDPTSVTAGQRSVQSRATSRFGLGMAEMRGGDAAQGQADIAQARRDYPGVDSEFATYGVTLQAPATTPSTTTR